MKFRTLTVFFLLSFSASKASEMQDAHGFFAWQQRPQQIKEKIDESYENLAKSPASRWSFNGREKYHLLYVDHTKLALYLIQRAKDQQEFFFVDIGAGDFQWGDHLAKVINASKNIQAGMKIHIIGIRAEKYQEPEKKTEGKCTLYKMGHFKIETLEEIFPARGLKLEKRLDMIVTSCTLRHLVNPLGTLTQAYNLLRSGGFIFFDNFYLGYEDSCDNDLEMENFNILSNMTRLLISAHRSFLIKPNHEGELFTNVVMRKTEKPLRAPVQYSFLRGIPLKPLCYSGVRVIFKYKGMPSFKDRADSMKDDDESLPLRLYGDSDLYKFFKENGLFEKEIPYGGPLEGN